MKQVAISRTEHSDSRLCETRVALREQVPLRDLADCLLAAYEGVSQRAFRLNQFRGAESGSELKDWKNAEHDLLVTMPVDLAESDENFHALASVPGYTAAEIGVAVEDSWLLISGYGHCSEQTNWARTMRNSMTARERPRTACAPPHIENSGPLPGGTANRIHPHAWFS